MIKMIAKKIKNKLSELKSELAYRISLWKHAKNLPTLQPSDRLIVDSLKQEGVYVTTLEELGLNSTSNMLQAAYNQLSSMETDIKYHPAGKLPQIYTVTDLPEFSAWGLEQRLLNILENYIGLTVTFQGVHLRKDFENVNQFGTLLWHKDSEDRRVVKAIIYLTDVEEQHGPFEYVPRALTSIFTFNFYRILYKLRQVHYYGINDETLNQIIPKSACKSCLGKAGTIVFVDTKNTLHHGTLRTDERSALFFVFTANPPSRPQDCTQYSDDTYARPELRQEVKTTF